MLTLFLSSLAVIAVVFAILRVVGGVRTALGGAMLSSFCFPSYWQIEIAQSPISVQTGAAVMTLLMYLATGGSLRFRMTACDLAVGFMVTIAFISDGLMHEGGILTLVRSYGEWMLPYGAGRYAFGSVSSLRPARWIAGAVVGVAAAIWVIDLTAQMNVGFELTQSLDRWEAPRRAMRFGWVRSAGLTEHPIFFSGMLMSLLPIGVITLCRNRQFDPTVKYLVGAAVLMIVCLTLSRAAVVALAITMVLGVALRFRRSRIPMTILGVLAIGLGVAFESQLWTWWAVTGDRSDQRQSMIVIDGEATVHSSSLARLRVYDVYGRAALRAGLLGYGTTAVTGFPPNLPYLPKEAMAIETVWTVENSYLLLVLRFGYVGLAAFLVLVASPVVLTMTQRDLELQTHLRVIMLGLVSVSVLLFTVYCNYQMVFPYLWVLGIMNALADPIIQRDPPRSPPPRLEPPLR